MLFIVLKMFFLSIGSYHNTLHESLSFNKNAECIYFLI